MDVQPFSCYDKAAHVHQRNQSCVCPQRLTALQQDHVSKSKARRRKNGLK